MNDGILCAASTRLSLSVLFLVAHGLPATARAVTPLTVFAAASLTEALGEVAEEFAAAPDGAPVRFQFAGSQQLARHVEDGAAADVLATADADWMEHVRSRGHLGSKATLFARNRLVVITPATKDARVHELRDLAGSATRIVLAAETVPAGRYSRDALRKLSRIPEFGEDYGRRVLKSVVSLEDSVKGVVAKVQLDEADAGIVYRSDVTDAVATRVRWIPIDDACNVTAEYYAAVLRNAADPVRAQRFVDFLSGPQARAILKRHGFVVDGR